MANESTTPKTVWDVKRRTEADTIRLERHHQRLDDPKNCDPKRRHLNRVLLGEDAPLDEIIERRKKSRPVKYHKAHDGKRYTTMIFSASPEYFDPAGTGWNQARVDRWIEAMVPLLREEFGDDILKATYHGDEKTPHIHVEAELTYLKTTKRGAVRWGSHDKHGSDRHDPKAKGRDRRGIGGGFKGYHGFLDRYAEAMAHLGIERGRATEGEYQSPTEKADHARKLLDEAKAEKSQATIDAILTQHEALNEGARIKREAQASADAMIAVAEKKARKAQAFARACETGAEAVIDEKIAYKAATEKAPETLKAGPNYPKDPAERKRLTDAIRPAWAWVVRFAKKCAGIREEVEKKEADLEARETKVKQNEHMSYEKGISLAAREKAVSEKEWIIEEDRARRARINARGVQIGENLKP